MGATILQDLVVVMVVAAAATILFYRLKLPVVLGYLLAGFLIGPHTPPFSFIHDPESVEALAELGILFLMFSVGLEFNLRKLRKVGAPAIVAAVFQLAGMIGLGYVIGQAFGWNLVDSVFLGAIISIASTTIVVKVLMEMGKIQEESAEVAMGITIVEDLAAVVIIAILSSFASTGGVEAAALGAALAKIGIFVLVAIAVGIVVVPRLIDWVSKFRVEEVLVISVVGLAFASALIATQVGFSVALGAFLMGAIIAESRAVKRVEHKVVPIRDLFSAVFFVAVGMLIDPASLKEHWLLIVVITLATVVGKALLNVVGTLLVGVAPGTALRVGMSLTPIGEFSFIIAGLGLSLGVMSAHLYPIAVAVCAITSLLAPFTIRFADRVADPLVAAMPHWLTRVTSTYDNFVGRFLTPSDTLEEDRNAAKKGTRVVLYAAWLLAVLIFGAYASLWLNAGVDRALTLSDNFSRAIGLLFLGLMSLPLFVAFARATEEWSRHLAKARSLNPTNLARSNPRYKGPRFVARAIAIVSSALLLAAAVRIAWHIHPLALPNPWLTGVVLGIVAVAGILSWRRLAHVYDWLEETLDTLLGQEEPAVDPVQKLRERQPWGIDVDEVVVLPHSWAAYMSLRDLRIRDQTGALVTSVERESAVITGPHPDMGLLPGDRIVLVGRRDQLDSAARLIHERGTPPRVHEKVVADEAPIEPRSPLEGRMIGHVGLRERTGAKVTGLSRLGAHFSPPAETRLRVGDRLDLVGTPEALVKAREMLRGPDEPKLKRGRVPRGEGEG